MWCCFASSRENTITLRGVPISPESTRRTNTRPNEPVPPVTSTVLPASSLLPRFPVAIGCVVGRQFGHHLPPRRRGPAQGAAQARAVESAHADESVIGLDFHRNPERVAGEAQQIVLRDDLPGEIIESRERRLVLQRARHGLGQLYRRDARVERLPVAA